MDLPMDMRMLRDYQRDIVTQIRTAWKSGVRSVMCQMPTGTGKTWVATALVGELGISGPKPDGQPCRVLVVAHRKEILDQTRATLERWGCGPGLQEGWIRVESIQRLSRLDSQVLTELGQPELVIIDEAHHATASTYRMLWDWWPQALFLGLTATPCRLKREGFTELFDRLVCSWPVKRFVDEGWLADYSYVVVKADSEMKKRIDGLKKRGVDGDFQIKEMGSVLDNRASIEQLWGSYVQYAQGRQGIIYAINREHAHHIAAFYAERLSVQTGEWPTVAVIDSTTPKSERAHILEGYSQGFIRLLVNCEIYSEGYDAPFVEFIQLARPTLSLSKYLQQVGRGLRPNRNGHKTVILDNVGMYYLFGLPSMGRDWPTMFVNGQEGWQPKLGSATWALEAWQEDELHEGDCLLDGHDLGMMRIDKVQQEREENGKAVVWAVEQDGCKGYVLRRLGKRCSPMVFQASTGFVDGVVCLSANSYGGWVRYFFDEDGNLLQVLNGQATLRKDGMVEWVNAEGQCRFRDLLTQRDYAQMPSLYRLGAACFVEEPDGWHIRSSRYSGVAARKDSIREAGGLVLFADCYTGQRFAVMGAQNVMAVMGEDTDGTLILGYDGQQEGLYVWRNGKLSFRRKQNTVDWIAPEWQGCVERIPAQTR